MERNYPLGLRVQVENRRGMIAVLATRLSAIGLNIERIATQNKDVEFTFVDLELQVSSRTHLAHVMKRLRSVEACSSSAQRPPLVDLLDLKTQRRSFMLGLAALISPVFNRSYAPIQRRPLCPIEPLLLPRQRLRP